MAKKERFSLLLVMGVTASMLLSACGGDATPTPPPAATSTTAPVAAATDTTAPVTTEATATTATSGTAPTATAGVAALNPVTDTLTGVDFTKVGPEIVDALAGKYKGTTVTMFGPFGDQDEVKFNSSMKPFEDATGIKVAYESSKEFETAINVRVQGGSPPDIADFPQPGLMASIAKSGKIIDANKMVNPDWLKTNYNQGFLDGATAVDNAGNKILGGVFQRVNAKGLIWYPKAQFDAAGYKVPTTWAELTALEGQIVADGDTPWCIGIESGTATGWPATDWTEQMMLRTTSLENYDKWVAGTLPFTDPIVKNAVQQWWTIWSDPKMVYGGTKQIVSTNFGDAPRPMFTNPAKCWLMDQGDFITSFFESVKPGVKGGVDYDFFPLPAINDQYGAPVEYGGDIMSAFADRPEVRAVMQYFSTFDGVKGWVEQGGTNSPHKDADLSVYPSAMTKKVAQTLVNASAVRFDGSDNMPGAVGSGTFWKAMTDFVSGGVDIDAALQEAQDGWKNVQTGPTPTTGAAAPTATAGVAALNPVTDTLTGVDFTKVGPEIVDALAGKYKGTTVTMFGPFGDQDEVKFNSSMKPFEDATGIKVAYESSKEFETAINVRVQGGSPPDIADFPQPGLMASIAKSGKIIDANKMVNPDWLKTNYNQGFLDGATAVDNAGNKILGGVFQRVNAKGLIWYPKAQFDAAGYKVPTTWAELTALEGQIVADGDTPWCIGIESGTATGWPATDWTEQMMLRTTSLENYDKWVAGTLPFTDPIVKNAVQQWWTIWSDPKMVYGGTKQIVSTNFGDAPRPMFTNPAKCWLMDQGDFITSFFESVKPGVKGGVDYDFFPLPAINDQYGAPVEYGGDIMSAFADRPEVRAVMQYFSTFDGVKGWVEQGGTNSPHKDADLSVYPSAMTKKVAQTLVNASAVRFDGSDNMPGAVGSGTFWKAMTDFVSGGVDIDAALQEAQDGWKNVQSGPTPTP